MRKWWNQIQAIFVNLLYFTGYGSASIFTAFFQTEEDANLAPQMGDGGFRFDPNAGGASGPQDPGSMQGTPFQFWFIKNSKKKIKKNQKKSKIRNDLW